MLQAFIYLLIRDHVPFGVIEAILQDLEKCEGKTFEFTEPLQAEYARTIKSRLEGKKAW